MTSGIAKVSAEAAMRRAIILIVSGTYLLSPLFYWYWLLYELESGSFPVEADSIGIPFAGFLVLWLAGFILAFFVGIGLLIRKFVLVKARFR